MKKPGQHSQEEYKLTSSTTIFFIFKGIKDFSFLIKTPRVHI
jgi:hypothetical protein